jgi:hypothetical protein
MENKHAERRRYPRRACDQALQASERERTFPCRALNTSQDGMMLETPEFVEVGQHITLRLMSQDGSRWLVAGAEIVWVTPHRDGWHCGVHLLSRQEDFVV